MKSMVSCFFQLRVMLLRMTGERPSSPAAITSDSDYEYDPHNRQKDNELRKRVDLVLVPSTGSSSEDKPQPSTTTTTSKRSREPVSTCPLLPGLFQSLPHQIHLLGITVR